MMDAWIERTYTHQCQVVGTDISHMIQRTIKALIQKMAWYEVKAGYSE